MEIPRDLLRFTYKKPNTTGSCWTCMSHNSHCSRDLPECRECLESGRACAGYANQPQWPRIKCRRRYFEASAPRNNGKGRRSTYKRGRDSSVAYERRISCWSPSGLGVTNAESHLIQHFANNVATIALAIDYRGNIFRSFIPMAMSDRALLNSILAVSAAHLSRWEDKEDTSSASYTRRALVEMESKLRDPVSASSESTLATILCLISMEAGNGSKGWKHHYAGLEGWLGWKTDTSQLDPFLKSWVFLAGFQAALVLGAQPSVTISRWLERSEKQQQGTSQQVVDPFLGYSVRLPRFLLKAASLQKARNESTMTEGELQCQVALLQQEIATCRLDTEKPILLASSCRNDDFFHLAETSVGQNDLWRRTGATAEIFRHAAHVYVHRICAPPGQTLPAEIQKSIDSVLELLALVPDLRGPGANLSWPLFVVGPELESPALRDVILDRWQSLHLLGMKSTRGAERILLETWKRNDSARAGTGAMQSWREVMHVLGEEQMFA